MNSFNNNTMVGEVVDLKYADAIRRVRIEKITPTYIVGWDYTANYPTGGYRTFTIAKIRPLESYVDNAYTSRD